MVNIPANYIYGETHLSCRKSDNEILLALFKFTVRTHACACKKRKNKKHSIIPFYLLNK